MKKELTILIAAVSIWTAGIIAAPLFSGSWTSDLLYRLYSAICHQAGSRSFHLFDEPFGVCIRCTSIYSGFLASLILIRILPAVRKIEWNALMLIVITSLPMAADGIFSSLNITEATSVTRILTGALFGIGLALMLHHVLCEFIQSSLLKLFKQYEPETR